MRRGTGQQNVAALAHDLIHRNESLKCGLGEVWVHILEHGDLVCVASGSYNLAHDSSVLESLTRLRRGAARRAKQRCLRIVAMWLFGEVLEDTKIV